MPMVLVVALFAIASLVTAQFLPLNLDYIKLAQLPLDINLLWTEGQPLGKIPQRIRLFFRLIQPQPQSLRWVSRLPFLILKSLHSLKTAVASHLIIIIVLNSSDRSQFREQSHKMFSRHKIIISGDLCLKKFVWKTSRLESLKIWNNLK